MRSETKQDILFLVIGTATILGLVFMVRHFHAEMMMRIPDELGISRDEIVRFGGYTPEIDLRPRQKQVFIPTLKIWCVYEEKHSRPSGGAIGCDDGC